MTSGNIIQINVKPSTPDEHGLPKKAVASAEIHFGGVDGDYNTYRQEKKSGEPDMAVMLITKDILDDLNNEGWPVGNGDLGENLTISDLAYASIEPEQKYRAGTALLQISFKCEPCTYLYSLLYIGDEKGPEFNKTVKDRRGWYARVLEEGVVNAGDQITLE
jgi:MOSC domain-containing protein YiiM